MNVLVYSGQGTTGDSVRHCVATLRLLLSPYYSVSTVEASTLINQPWESKTSAIVMPGGADLPLCRAFNGAPNKKIRRFVEGGGVYIGFCSGGYYGSKRVEFEVGTPMEVSGPRELGFYPGTCRGCAYKGFHYGSHIGARAAKLDVNGETIVSYYNGGGMFVGADKYSDTVEVVARFSEKVEVEDDPGSENAAMVVCKVGRGAALLSGAHPEFSADLLEDSPEVPGFDHIIEEVANGADKRLAFLRSCLRKLNLKVNDNPTRPSLTPMYLTSLNPSNTQDVAEKLMQSCPLVEGTLVNGGQDTFNIHASLNEEYHHPAGYEDPETAVKDLFVCKDGYPDMRTVQFDFHEYYNELVKTCREVKVPPVFGSTLMYGGVITSTSTLMDANLNFLSGLPQGFTVHGTVQVLGRGRTGNYWVNPVGVLAVSVLVQMELKTSLIVFIQYLGGLAFVEAIKRYAPGFDEVPVKIKWPNDIYILRPEFVGRAVCPNDAYIKVGGVMVNSNVVDGKYYLVVGTGCNVSNGAPTTSINLVVDAMNKLGAHLESAKIEKLLAKYLAIFNAMFNVFIEQGFEPFLPRYYDLWLHSHQIVHILEENNARAEIMGITPDWGMLLAREVDQKGMPTGAKFELQPDGNSFDIFKGLISKKEVMHSLSIAS